MPLACAMAFSSGVVMKPATVVRVGAVIDRVDRDDGVLGLRILQDRQRLAARAGRAPGSAG